MCDLDHDTQYVGVPNFNKWRPQETYSPANLLIASCGHIFHSACLYVWLEEALSAGVHECGRIPAIRRVPPDMRARMAVAKCASCKGLQTMVRESQVGVREL